MSMSECDARLKKLQRYLPFLHRTKASHHWSVNDSLKIKTLINIISNAGEKLLAKTLEKCEIFCRTLYLKYGKENEMEIIRNDSSCDDFQHLFQAGPNYKTGETKQFSPHYMPNAPNQQADSKWPIKLIPVEKSSNDRHSFHPKPPAISEHSSRPFRMESIEIGLPDVSIQDQGRLRSRFDRDEEDRYSKILEPEQLREESFQNNQPIINHRDVQSPFLNSYHCGEQDLSFQGIGSTNSTLSGPRPERSSWKNVPSNNTMGWSKQVQSPTVSCNNSSQDSNSEWNCPKEPTSGNRLFLHPVPNHPVPNHSVPSHPLPSHPLPSHPLPSHPVPKSLKSTPSSFTPKQQNENLSQVSSSSGAASQKEKRERNKPVVRFNLPSKPTKKKIEARIEPTKPPTTSTTKNTIGTSSQDPIKFLPIDGLYIEVSKTRQSGRGYSLQTYKIPKNKTSDVCRSRDNRLDESTVMSPESSSTNVAKEDAILTDRKNKEPQADNSSIPLQVMTEEVPTKTIPSDDVDVVLDGFETNLNEQCKAASSPSTTKPDESMCSITSNVDSIVTFSEDVLDASNIEETPPKVVTSSARKSVKPGPPAKRGRKRKAAAAKQSSSTTVPAAKKKIRGNSRNEDPNPISSASKGKKRKKSSVPTHLSLRGRPSMFEEYEPNEQVEKSNSPDQYFQCDKCPYLGRKIVYHYVNDHPYVENPFISIPESEWKAISSQDLTTVPAHHQVDTDLSWIPARLCYTNPVQCKFCPFTTCKRSELVEHVMVHSLPANCKYRCTLCGRMETDFFEMLDHIAGHTGEFRYQCNYCDLKFANRCGIKYHMNCIHKAQDGYYYTSNFSADSGQLWIYGFVCTTCRYVQMTEEHLVRHGHLHSECNGYKKVSLVQDANIMTKPEEENSILSYPAGKENGKDELNFKETSKLQSVSLIETVDNPYPDEEVNPPIPELPDNLDRPEIETRSDPSTDIQEEEIIQQIQEESSDKTRDKNVPSKPKDNVGNEQISTEEGSIASGVFHINNIVSLVDDNEDDILDPDSSIVFSSITIAKNEVKFPYSPSHDRPKFAIQLKDEVAYTKMLEHCRLKNLFKCMAHSCIFSSNSASDFTNHLEWHKKRYFTPNPSQQIREERILPKDGDRPYTGGTLTLPDFYLCSSCPFGAGSPVELSEHVKLIHGGSLFQCSACFFRAKKSKMVEIHIMVSHIGKRAFTLVCNWIGPSNPEVQPEQLTLIQVPRYRCPVNDCGFASIIPDSLIQHLSTLHSEVKHFSCRQCAENFVGNSYYTQLFSHMNTHGMGFFQCAFCLWGTQQPIDALIHLCLQHPSLDGKILTRSTPTNPSTPSVLSKFWAIGANSPTYNISLGQKYMDLFDKVAIIENVLLPEEDMVTITEDLIQEKTVVEEDDSVAVKEPENELNFFGFDEEEQAETKKQVECIVIESDSEEESQGKLEGLYGRQLYMCGNIGCDETAETVAEFKEHLMVCDLARDIRVLTCRHCGKTMRLIPHLILHLKYHGVKRFSCGICSFRSYQAGHVRNHMKSRHRESVVEKVPVGPGPGPANAENVLHTFFPKK